MESFNAQTEKFDKSVNNFDKIVSPKEGDVEDEGLDLGSGSTESGELQYPTSHHLTSKNSNEIDKPSKEHVDNQQTNDGVQDRLDLKINHNLNQLEDNENQSLVETISESENQEGESASMPALIQKEVITSDYKSQTAYDNSYQVPLKINQSSDQPIATTASEEINNGGRSIYLARDLDSAKNEYHDRLEEKSKSPNRSDEQEQTKIVPLNSLALLNDNYAGSESDSSNVSSSSNSSIGAKSSRSTSPSSRSNSPIPGANDRSKEKNENDASDFDHNRSHESQESGKEKTFKKNNINSSPEQSKTSHEEEEEEDIKKLIENDSHSPSAMALEENQESGISCASPAHNISFTDTVNQSPTNIDASKRTDDELDTSSREPTSSSSRLSLKDKSPDHISPTVEDTISIRKQSKCEEEDVEKVSECSNESFHVPRDDMNDAQCYNERIFNLFRKKEAVNSFQSIAEDDKNLNKNLIHNGHYYEKTIDETEEPKEAVITFLNEDKNIENDFETNCKDYTKNGAYPPPPSLSDTDLPAQVQQGDNAVDCNQDYGTTQNVSSSENMLSKNFYDSNCTNSSVDSRSSADKLVIDHPITEKTELASLMPPPPDDKPVTGPIKLLLKRRLSTFGESGSFEALTQQTLPKQMLLDMNLSKENSVPPSFINMAPVTREAGGADEDPVASCSQSNTNSSSSNSAEISKCKDNKKTSLKSMSNMAPSSSSSSSRKKKRKSEKTCKTSKNFNKSTSKSESQKDVEQANVDSPPQPINVISSNAFVLDGAAKVKKKLYKCSSCNSYHDQWHLFLHMRQFHDRHICLYCFHFFRTTEKLSLHLEMTHDMDQKHYNNEQVLRESKEEIPELDNVEVHQKRWLMCCTCSYVFLDIENFSDHNCGDFIKACDFCGEKGRHSLECKAHPSVEKKVAKEQRKEERLVKMKNFEKKESEEVLKRPTSLQSSAVDLSSYFSTPSTLELALKGMKPTHGEPNSIPMVSDMGTESVRRLFLPEESSKNFQPTPNQINLYSPPPVQELIQTKPADFTNHPKPCLTDNKNSSHFKSPKITLNIGISGENNPSNEHLNGKAQTFPKFKLRVPKEFQKSVDASLSSSDSEETESDGDSNPTEDKTQHNANLGVDNSATESAPEVTPSPEDQDTNSSDNNDPDSSANADNLARILKQIEQTKLDIQKTQETMLANTQQRKYSKAQPESEGILEPPTDRENPAKNWSPTPPASPKASPWLSLQKLGQLQAQKEGDQLGLSTLPPTPKVTQNRTISEGSDNMDIDDTITGGEQHIPLMPTDNEENLKDSPLPKENLDNTSEKLESCDQELKDTENPLHISSALTQDVIESPVNVVSKELNISNEEIDVCGQSESTLAESSQLTEEETIAAKQNDGFKIASEDILPIDVIIEKTVDEFEPIEIIRTCLKFIYPFCLYCNHARRIAVNIDSLIRHILGQHRFRLLLKNDAEQQPEEICFQIIVEKLKGLLPDLENEYMNIHSYCTIGDGKYSLSLNERIYECFQCRFVAVTHKELYLHNRRMHLKTAILCHMCRANFYSFCEILCHICPGAPNKTSIFDVKFRCCLCEVDKIPSPFRLMVHLRKKHFACDVCLEDCRDQSRLSSHVWKHKLSHLCYRCGIAYRNKMDITKHLFWKHGTESTSCKRCLQKRWRHVYHFCIPPAVFTCDVCELCFSKAMYLKVHKRIHSGDFRYPCTEENCDEKFVSRKLLLKHIVLHQMPVVPSRKNSVKDDNDFKGDSQEEIGIKEEPSIETIKKEEDRETLDATSITETKSEVSLMEPEVRVSGTKDETEENENENNQDDRENDSKEALEKTENKVEEGSKDPEVTPRKKRKHSKRDKGLLDDLNLMAPNLSESDSSDDDTSSSDDNGAVDMQKKFSLLGSMAASPKSDAETNENTKTAEASGDESNVLELWKKILDAQKTSGTSNETTEYTDDNYPRPVHLHVAISDHDYCKMLPPEVRKPLKTSRKRSPSPKKIEQEKEKEDNNEITEKGPPSVDMPESSSQPSPPKLLSPKPFPNTDNKDEQSSTESSSDSSCSCSDSNCSCSSSDTDSSTTGSSSESDTSAGSDQGSISKRIRKRSRKSESVSPTKNLFKAPAEALGKTNENISQESADNHNEETVVDENSLENGTNQQATALTILSKEPVFYESDLETAESETDEEFYDEHPQKLANELLAQKRAQLLAETRLSPSHNFDIVENSRPSTPSLPEEYSYGEKRTKIKKKKRERKSSNRGGNLSFTKAGGVTIPEYSMNIPVPSNNHNGELALNYQQQTTDSFPIKPFDSISQAPLSVSTDCTNDLVEQDYAIPSIPYPTPSLLAAAAAAQIGGGPHITKHNTLPLKITGRISEGSSSDLDNSLKRSKRARRPNKFYGYTSDDENMSSVLAQPLYIGLRAVKPEPPPQLTWAKEDLPTPSKSILNPKNKNRTPKTPNTPLSQETSAGWPLSKSGKRKRGSEQQSSRKRASKKKEFQLPPIPTLKIPLSQIGLNTSGVGGSAGSTKSHEKAKRRKLNQTPPVKAESSNDSSSDEGEIPHVPTNLHSYDSSKTPGGISWNKGLGPGNSQGSGAQSKPSNYVNQQVVAANPVQSHQPAPSLAQFVLPPPPPVPTPQATAFNHRIPPALLPNPDFATLQYFKANNIRYPIRPPAGARQARDGESVYCYCRSPYDEVSEMIACDGDNCLIEWFHFECVGIILAPQGKWFCAECRPKHAGELYPEGAGNFSQ